jgi:hypothetical protein
MSKTFIYKWVILTGLYFFTTCSAAMSRDARDMFPKLEGWDLNIGDKVYVPENLFDIINGAADGYLSYDFQKLYTAEYFNDNEKQIRVYIFMHSNPVNAFGIYSQERHPDYEFNETGAQGFESAGSYYFLTGNYYIQITTHHEGLDDTLEELAQLMNEKLDQDNRLPAELELFPGRGKIAASEKYVANNFLGYSYLHSAFIADYEQGGESFNIFIISPQNEQQTEKMLNEYLDFVKFPERKRTQSKYIIEDPYNGTIHLIRTGKYIGGIMGGNKGIREEYTKFLKDNLN